MTASDDPADERADLLSVARQVGPSLAARSGEIEAARTLPADVVADLRDAGLFRLFVPVALEGPELTVREFVDVVEELAYHDGASGWCAMIASTTSALAAFLPAEHAHATFGDPDAITGGFAAPVGRARVTDGGLVVSGRWAWGSGTRHCTTIGGGCVVVDADGAPTPRADGLAAPFVLFDPADVTFLDTWHVSGLCGTGSTDYEVHDVVVPEGRWVELGTAEPLRGGPLYRFSFFGLLAVGVASVALGLARRAVDELVSMAADKRPQGSARPLAERAPVQADVAAAEAIVLSCRAFLDDAVGSAWHTVESGAPLTVDQKRLLRLAATHATQESARATDLMYTAGGGAAIYATSPLQRVFRDVHVATQHAMVAPRMHELVGRLRLGLPTDTQQL